VERGEWDDDADDARAPLPPHERTWRHPSELGASNWVQSEPPLVVGRGLSIATGTVGALLAVGLLWLMIPRDTRSGVAVEASTTSGRSEPAQSFAPSAAVAQNAPIPALTTNQAPPTSAVAATNEPLPSVTTLALVPTTVAAASTEPSADAPPSFEPVENTLTTDVRPTVAIALQPGHLVVTTASAVNGRSELRVMLPSGEEVMAAVVHIDGATGTAVLRLPTELTDSQYELSDVSTFDTAMAMSPGPQSVSVYADEQGGQQVAYGEGHEPDEASVVLDGQGRLLGMCTKNTSGVHLVAAAALLDALNAARANEQAPTRLGVTAALSATGDIAVQDVVPDSPAAQSGLLTGDIIRSVDAVAVADLKSLTDAVARHVVGTPLVISVVRVGTVEPLDIAVTVTGSTWSL
jgi:S1-C subfamily serine protease